MRLSRFLIGSDFSYGKAENPEQEMEPGEHIVQMFQKICNSKNYCLQKMHRAVVVTGK